MIAVLTTLVSASMISWVDDQKPNTLTKEEIAQGWILLFDGETTFGWKTTGDVAVENGELVIGAAKDSTIDCTTTFGAGKLRFEYRIDVEPVGSLLINGENAGTGNPADKGEWRSFDHDFDQGRVRMGVTIPSGGKSRLRSIAFLPSGGKPIFDGKTLEGWKEIPGKKSKFTVTPEGWINVKDGNGDLQTVEQWDDFVYQMEIISNGKHLNSGVFYRAIPDEFWSGYESQIRNEWITDLKLKDGTKVSGSYTDKGDMATVQACKKANREGTNWIPARDVKTLKKNDIAEVVDFRNRPVDIGTGGIYNRQPARKVVPSDNEWFTMTIVAVGNHHSVWVNGYQTADYDDNARPAKSARNGRKDEKGVISLQGHDPTTDLSFRNIRIAAVPKGS